MQVANRCETFNPGPLVRLYRIPDRATLNIAKRFGLTLAHAVIVAQLAGLGTEGR